MGRRRDIRGRLRRRRVRDTRAGAPTRPYPPRSPPPCTMRSPEGGSGKTDGCRRRGSTPKSYSTRVEAAEDDAKGLRDSRSASSANTPATPARDRPEERAARHEHAHRASPRGLAQAEPRSEPRSGNDTTAPARVSEPSSEGSGERRGASKGNQSEGVRLPWHHSRPVPRSAVRG